MTAAIPVPPQALDAVRAGLIPASNAPARPRLTPTQTLALTLVADGVPYQQIAERLHLAEGTVRRLMSDAFRVLGVRNKAGAVRAGVEAGILDLRGVRE